MGGPSRSFQAKLAAQEIVQRFGAGGKAIRVSMRDCDDVPQYIEKVARAHQRTASSTLRFGPPAPEPHRGT